MLLPFTGSLLLPGKPTSFDAETQLSLLFNSNVLEGSTKNEITHGDVSSDWLVKNTIDQLGRVGRGGGGNNYNKFNILLLAHCLADPLNRTSKKFQMGSTIHVYKFYILNYLLKVSNMELIFIECMKIINENV